MKPNHYVSSMIKNYGDTDRVREDVKTLIEILGRQGHDLLLDVVAEHIGDASNKFKLSPAEREILKNKAVEHLKTYIEERT